MHSAMNRFFLQQKDRRDPVPVPIPEAIGEKNSVFAFSPRVRDRVLCFSFDKEVIRRLTQIKIRKTEYRISVNLAMSHNQGDKEVSRSKIEPNHSEAFGSLDKRDE